MNRFYRIALAGSGLVFSLLALGCGGGGERGLDADGLHLIRVQTDWYAQPEHGGFYQALATGRYRDAGLNVTITPGGPNAMVAQKVSRGLADFGIGRLDDISVMIDKGMPLVIVSALMQRDPQGIMLHADNPINSIAEMDGQRVMVGVGTVMVKLMEEKFNLSIRVIPLDYGIGRFMTDKTFIQQCFVTSEPYFVAKQGAEAKVILISEMGFDPYRVIFTRRELAEQQPEVVAAFVEATIAGWNEFVSPEGDRSGAVALISSENAAMSDPEFIDFSINTMREYHLIEGNPELNEATGLLRKARIQEGIDLLREVNLIENVSTAEEVFTTAFLPPHLQAMLAPEEKVPLR